VISWQIRNSKKVPDLTKNKICAAIPHDSSMTNATL